MTTGDPGLGLNARLADDDGPPSPTTGFGLVRWVLRRQRTRVLVGAAAGIVWMGGLALVPVALGRALDDGVDGGTDGDVVRWCAVIAVVVMAGSVAGVVRHRTAVLLAVRTRWLLERLVTRRALDGRGGATGDAGVLLAHAESDPRSVGLVADLMCRGSGAVVTFLGVGIGLLVTSPLLGAIVLVGLPPCLLLLVPLWRPYEERAAEQQIRVGAATSTAADVLLGLRVVKGLGGEPTVRSWFARGTADLQRSAVSVARLGAAWTSLSAAIPGVFLAIVLWVGGRLALDGSLAPGELVTFTGLAVFLAIPLATIAEVGDVWASGLAGARRIARTLAAAPAVPDSVDGAGDAVDRAGDAPGLPVDGGIVLGGVHHGPLADLDLAVADGELLGVVCPDPGAAAVLTDLLARRVDPDRGTVVMGGADIATIPLADLRRHALVDDGHQPWLTGGTLRDNVLLGRPDGDDVEVAAALLVAAAEELADRPAGLDERLGDGGLALSGGQRQRVTVARAVAAGRPVLVLDDPTSALDTVTETHVARRLAAARAGRTTVVLTISPTVLAVCGRVVLVDRGRVVASGRHRDLLAEVPAYRAVVAGEPEPEPAGPDTDDGRTP
jgi:putative ABC transport system ATP-binding protein